MITLPDAANAAALKVEKHAESDAAHKTLFDQKADANKDALDEIIGEATEKQRGLMTPAQVAELKSLAESIKSTLNNIMIRLIVMLCYYL